MHLSKPIDTIPAERTALPPQPAVELIDCGSVSTGTHGLPDLIFFEVGTPPNNRYFEDW